MSNPGIEDQQQQQQQQQQHILNPEVSGVCPNNPHSACDGSEVKSTDFNLRCETARLKLLNTSLIRRNDDVANKLEGREDGEARRITKDLNDDLKRQNEALMAHASQMQAHNSALWEMLQNNQDGQAAVQMHRAAELLVKGLANAEEEVQALKTNLGEVEAQRDSYKNLLARTNSELLSSQAYAQMSMSENSGSNNNSNEIPFSFPASTATQQQIQQQQQQQQRPRPQRAPASDRDISRLGPGVSTESRIENKQGSSFSGGGGGSDPVAFGRGASGRDGADGVGDTQVTTGGLGGNVNVVGGAHPLGSSARETAGSGGGVCEQKGGSQEMDVYSDSRGMQADEGGDSNARRSDEGGEGVYNDGEQAAGSEYDSDNAPSMFF